MIQNRSQRSVSFCDSPRREVRSQKFASRFNKKLVFLLYALCSVFCVLSSAYCSAEETKAVITSDYLEYDKDTSTYTAKGSVKIQRDKTSIEAKEMRYNEKTADVFAEGDVKYDVPALSLNAEKAEYNLDTKSGKFYNAEIFSKHDNFHISGEIIEKRGEKEYFFTKASATTCDGLSPAWCLKGRDADLIIGDRLEVKDVTFNIKGFPVLYSPYIWAPVATERQTGFLTPGIGYTEKKGIHLKQPFYWAISENKDATFILDWYSERGLGEGLEYRYIDIGNIRGINWFYHIYDAELEKNFYEIRLANEKRDEDGFSAYLNLNYVNEKDFYSEYSAQRYERINRFLESTGEISSRAEDSRIYLASQYLIDLKDGTDSSTTLQKLPELGYVVNPYMVGPMTFSFTASAANFWREEGVYGQRLDIYPKFSHSFGDTITVFQSLGLRETAYSLQQNETEGYSDSVLRELFDYNITASARILKKYSNFTHAIEPSLAYTFIPWVKQEETDVPIFDSTEAYSRQSTASISILNRLIDKKGEFFTLSISESYNSYGGDTPFSSLSLAAAIKRPFQIRGDTSYNSYTNRIDSINSDVSMSLNKLSLSFGERYNISEDTMSYSGDISYAVTKNLYTMVGLWYDAKGEGLTDASLKINYKKQCWGMTIAVDKSPDDYSINITFDLLGLGSLGM